MNRIYLNFDKVHMTETVFLHTYVSSCFLPVSVWRYNEHIVNVRLCISTSESSKICMIDYQSRLLCLVEVVMFFTTVVEITIVSILRDFINTKLKFFSFCLYREAYFIHPCYEDGFNAASWRKCKFIISSCCNGPFMCNSV